VARINTASQRPDLLPWAFARDVLFAPVVGACAIVVAPPADHPVFALRAAMSAEPCPKTHRERAHQARTAVRANDRPRLRHFLQAFKIFTPAL
jgi:hypothetical protein